MDKPDNLTSNEYRFRTTTSNEQWEPVSFVDATPDDNYPIRILEASLKNCEGIMVGDSPIVEMMNKFQADRAVILTKAIQILKQSLLNG